MAHPFQSIRENKVQRDRVGRITKGYADGGPVKPVPMPVAQPKAKTPPMDADASESNKPAFLQGKKALKNGGRLDRYARGGKVKPKGTVVNVIIAPQGAKEEGLPPMPPVGAGAPIPPAAALPPPPMPPMAKPGLPPGMPMRASGGRVSDGPAWKDGLKNGTKVQHTDGKNDGSDIYRGRQITYKRGGAVEASNAKGPKLPGGDNGKGRLAKAALQRRSNLP